MSAYAGNSILLKMQKCIVLKMEGISAVEERVVKCYNIFVYKTNIQIVISDQLQIKDI